MSTTTLTLASDLSIGSAWSKNGFSTSYSAALNNFSTSTYGSVGSNATGATAVLQMDLSSIPGNVTAITGVQVSLLIKCVENGKALSNLNMSVGNSTSATHLAAETSCSPTTSFSTINTTLTLNDSTIADWSSAYLWLGGPNDGNGNVLDVAGASVILTVTLSSLPGTPTSLVASYASSTSTTLTWTQGSGTVTDNLIKYGTDGSTFGTTIDIGSAATTYTITGITANQLYFFEVAAKNTGGTSAYTSPVPWVCGSNWTVQVSQSSDDAYQSTTGTVTIADATDAPFASAVPPTATQYLGWRFLDVAIGQAPIIDSQLWFYLSSVSSPTGTGQLDCQLSTSPATFVASTDNISNRTLTGSTGSVALTGASAGWQKADVLMNAVGAVVAQPAWAPGDNIAVVMIIAAENFSGLTFEMYDGNPVQAAILAISTGSNPVWSGFGVTGGIEESGRVGPGVIAVQTAVIGSACW